MYHLVEHQENLHFTTQHIYVLVMIIYWINSFAFLMSHLLSLHGKRSISPITGLEWPRRFQEVKVPRLRDNGPGWC